MEYIEKKCPHCSKNYKSYLGFQDWCEHCEWNLYHIENERIVLVKSKYEKIVEKLGNKYSQNLFQELMSSELIAPKYSISSFIALMAGILIFLSWVTMIVIGVYFLTLLPNFYLFFAGAFLLALAIYMRPKFSKKPKQYLLRNDAPNLYKTVDEINVKIGGDPIEYIVLSQSFNASMSYAGVNRVKVLEIGYPLFLVLSKQEFVFLLGHELSHNVNRDPARKFIHYNALRMLREWHSITLPSEWVPIEEVGLLVKLGSLPFYFLMWCFSQTVLGCSYMYLWLIHRDSQKAEYFADYSAVLLSGNSCVKDVFRKLGYGALLANSVQKAVLSRSNEKLLEGFNDLVISVPEKENIRIEKVNMSYTSRIDSTHPPTPYRVEFLQKRGNEKPEYVLDDERFKAIRKELSKYEKDIEYTLVDDYRYTNYI